MSLDGKANTPAAMIRGNLGGALEGLAGLPLFAGCDLEKVSPAASSSLIGFAGAAGVAIEMVRLYQVKLGHYEKIGGLTMSLDGKANRLAAMIRGNLGAALQGLAVVPLFAGYDLD